MAERRNQAVVATVPGLTEAEVERLADLVEELPDVLVPITLAGQQMHPVAAECYGLLSRAEGARAWVARGHLRDGNRKAAVSAIRELLGGAVD